MEEQKLYKKEHYQEVKFFAVVYQTGFKTVKGNLIRKILFPKEEDENFTRDSVKIYYFYVYNRIWNKCLFHKS